MSGEPNFSNRKYVIGGIAVVVVVLYMVRLFSLQLMSDDYKKNADSNAFRKEIFHVGSANTTSLGGISIDNESFLYRGGTGGDYTILSLDFYNANLAGTDFIDVLQKAQTGNINTNGGSGLHNCSALGNGNF